MNSLEDYLKYYYQTANQLAADCSISSDELVTLVREKLVPHASYTVLDGGRMVSQAFGELSVPDSTPGQYYIKGVKALLY